MIISNIMAPISNYTSVHRICRIKIVLNIWIKSSKTRYSSVQFGSCLLFRVKLFDNLRLLPHVPGVQMQRNSDVDRLIEIQPMFSFYF